MRVATKRDHCISVYSRKLLFIYVDHKYSDITNRIHILAGLAMVGVYEIRNSKKGLFFKC